MAWPIPELPPVTMATFPSIPLMGFPPRTRVGLSSREPAVRYTLASELLDRTPVRAPPARVAAMS